MKNWLVIFCISFSSFTTFAQFPTQEQKQQYIAKLDSADEDIRFQALHDILEYEISEALPKIEEKFWIGDATYIGLSLIALEKFHSPNLQAFARAFFDSAESLAKRPFALETALELKVQATYFLHQTGDYSTTSYIFEHIRRGRKIPLAAAQNTLKSIIQRVPEYADSAKEELLKITTEHPFWFSRVRAIDDLVEVYGEEMFPQIVGMFHDNNAVDAVIRIHALELLFKMNYPDLHNLLRERLSQEPEPAYRGTIADSLLFHYGTPEDYLFVKNYQTQETDPVIKPLLGFTLRDFKPPVQPVTAAVLSLLDSLISTTQQVASLNWLGDGAFVTELNANLQSARSYLVSGDSLNCAIQVRAYQSKVDGEYKDSLDANSKTVTVEGWKFLYYNAQYILDRLPAVPTAISYSLFATHSMHLEQNSNVLSGDIGVNEAGEPPFLDSQVELSIGIGTSTAAGYDVKANRIKIKSGATVNSAIHYNELDNNGSIAGTQNTPLQLPLVVTLPEFKSATPGTEDIQVPQNGSLTLEPGNYDTFDVNMNGVVTFTGGVYHFNSWNSGDDVQIIFQAPSEVRIADKFDSGQGSYIGPQDTTTITADQIIFYVGGINGGNGNLGATPKAVKIGIGNTVWASFYAPNGTLWIRQNSEAKGQFIGKDVDVGIGVKVRR